MKNIIKDILALPKPLLYLIIVTVAVSWIPLALIARARYSTSPNPPIHLVPNMDNQPKFKAQQENPLFADGRAMRQPLPGTVARGELKNDDAYWRGVEGDEWTETIPIRVDRSVMARGQERFEIYCAPCHGLTGDGNGIINQRATKLQEGTWIPPTSYHTDTVRQRPVGHLFNTITHGIRKMPAYGAQINVDDRWAIVAYVRALQKAHDARIEDVPADRRESLR